MWPLGGVLCHPAASNSKNIYQTNTNIIILKKTLYVIRYLGLFLVFMNLSFYSCSVCICSLSMTHCSTALWDHSVYLQYQCTENKWSYTLFIPVGKFTLCTDPSYILGAEVSHSASTTTMNLHALHFHVLHTNSVNTGQILTWPEWDRWELLGQG